MQLQERDTMRILGFDEAELKSRRAFFEIGDEDLARLASLRPFAERHTDEIVEELYELFLGHPESARFFVDPELLRRVKNAQREYFRGLFAGRCDLDYVRDRLRIGIAHERAGVPWKFYIGGYSRYLRSISRRLAQELTDPEAARAATESITKLVAFDMALAVDSYMAERSETIARHRVAIRELSTPVIRIWERMLLLPLVGTIDTERAEQLMKSVLGKVVEEHARIVIIDILGVPVVDTSVAEHLLETAEAARLMGAQTILTGISPVIAKTMVSLGIDVSRLHTRSQLADGLALAFEFEGQKVVPEWEVRRPRKARAPRKEREQG